MKKSDINCSLVVPAAGQGKRFGGDLPKQFTSLMSIPVIIRTLLIFDKMKEIGNVVIAVDSAYKKLLKDYIDKYKINKNAIITEGGIERQDSILNAIESRSVKDADIILVHDAVRPLATDDLFVKIIKATKKFGAAVPGTMPKETIKCINQKNIVENTLSRQYHRNIQTPQGFKKEIFIKMYETLKSGKNIVTDDASLAEQIGFKVKVIEGEEQNIKITTATDLILAEAILKIRKNIIKK